MTIPSAGSAIRLAILGAVLAAWACTQVFAAAPAASFRGPMPGPRTCFWIYPPSGADPYLNLAYPDAGAHYWTASFAAPAGSKLELRGDFPHARYMSLISYDADGKPIEALADYKIVPVAGATNPFATGAARNAPRRGFRIELSQAAPDAPQGEGERIDGSAQNVLHIPGSGAQHLQTLIYRVYVPDRGRDIVGGAALPQPVLTLASGKILEGAAACAAIKSTAHADVVTGSMSIPLAQYRQLAAPGGHAPGWPATSPPTWYVQYDRQYLLGIYTGAKPAGTRRSEGGFYPNPDNNYIRTIINRAYGRVLVLQGHMPRTPRTFAGDRVMGSGELRYWSVCTNEGFANTRVTACLYDEQVPLDANGNYTIVVSRAADRPRNAIARCGVAWLRWADVGDGAVDENAGVLQIRNMLAAPDFAGAIQRVADIGTEKQVMGNYLPTATYLMVNEFESEQLCPL